MSTRNLLEQEPWERRGENDARIRALETKLALIETGAWTGWTPTLTQGGAVAKTVAYARYAKIGRTVIAQIQLDVTGTGSATTDVIIGMPSPTPVIGAGASLGAGSIYNASNFATYPAEAELQAGGATLILKNTTASGIQVLGSANFMEALASGDVVRYSITYEAAS